MNSATDKDGFKEVELNISGEEQRGGKHSKRLALLQV